MQIFLTKKVPEINTYTKNSFGQKAKQARQCACTDGRTDQKHNAAHWPTGSSIVNTLCRSFRVVPIHQTYTLPNQRVLTLKATTPVQRHRIHY